MQVILSKDAAKQFSHLVKSEQKKIKKKLILLESDPFAGKKLSGDLERSYTLRAWPYRIIYKLNSQDQRVEVSAIWKVYTNIKYGFSIKYPLDKGFEINEELQNSIFIAVPQSDYGLVISIEKNLEVLNLVDWLKKQNFASTQINGKPLKFSDLTITNKTVAEYSGLEVSGPIPSYILISSQDKKNIFKISGYTLEEKLFNQILSTFKFTN